MITDVISKTLFATVSYAFICMYLPTYSSAHRIRIDNPNSSNSSSNIKNQHQRKLGKLAILFTSVVNVIGRAVNNSLRYAPLTPASSFRYDML